MEIEQKTVELTETELKKLSELYNCSKNYILEGKEEYTSIFPDNYLDINNLDRTTARKMDKIIRKSDSSPKMPREIGE